MTVKKSMRMKLEKRTKRKKENEKRNTRSNTLLIHYHNKYEY
jgi:hypothetical protein